MDFLRRSSNAPIYKTTETAPPPYCQTDIEAQIERPPAARLGNTTDGGAHLHDWDATRSLRAVAGQSNPAPQPRDRRCTMPFMTKRITTIASTVWVIVVFVLVGLMVWGPLPVQQHAGESA
ncbi:hypothetical protein LTR37_002965 [Vermiconidia calcicola]|uniref:Uncharacterized protein n=1 Tax=Vermiconidia calcicola TaxID=1690605 RepID=A0ACC3NUA8_9PEZI|nr:hypothetical protein LTR37_002965 [Vermiconidia calcicola]